jgi:hypothetical protein
VSFARYSIRSTPSSEGRHAERAQDLRVLSPGGICMPVKDQLDRLATFEPAPFPVVNSILMTSAPSRHNR